MHYIFLDASSHLSVTITQQVYLQFTTYLLCTLYKAVDGAPLTRKYCQYHERQFL